MRGFVYRFGRRRIGSVVLAMAAAAALAGGTAAAAAAKPVPHPPVKPPSALAILLRFGPGPAALIYVLSSVIADLAGRLAPLKILFNAAQYLLAIVAAAGVLALAGASALTDITGGDLPIVLAAAAVFFVTN